MVFRIVLLKERKYGGEEFELSAREEDLRSDPRSSLFAQASLGAIAMPTPKWKAFDVDLPEMGFFKPTESNRRATRASRYVKRKIVHDSFKNISGSAAIRSLVNKEPGEAVFRPSRKGLAHLNVTWKVGEGIFLHADILDLNQKDAATPKDMLGNRLQVYDTTCESLDEILESIIYPRAQFASAMMEHRKYVSGGHDEVERILADAHEKNPKRVEYRLHYMPDAPGYFMLTYHGGKSSNGELRIGKIPIKLTQHGYEVYGRKILTPDKLVSFFQDQIEEGTAREDGERISSEA